MYISDTQSGPIDGIPTCIEEKRVRWQLFGAYQLVLTLCHINSGPSPINVDIHTH